MHRSQAFCEPRVTAQAVPLRCDRQVNECWVAERDGLIKVVERFIEPACVPIQNGAEECHLQQRVEVQLRVRDLIHQNRFTPERPAVAYTCCASAVTCFNTATLSSEKPNSMALLTVQAANLLTSPIFK